MATNAGRMREKSGDGKGIRKGHRKISEKVWLRNLAQHLHVELCATNDHPSAKFCNSAYTFLNFCEICVITREFI